MSRATALRWCLLFPGMIGEERVTRRVRLIALLGVIALLIGGGVFVTLRLVGGVNAIPQVDLFGDETPSATPGQTPTPSPTVPPGSDIKGPLNFLILGVDTRETQPGWVPNGDAIMILHVNKDLTKAYLTSLPRDLVVNVPGHGTTKITHAMAYGSRVSGTKRVNYAGGFQLMARTVSNYTGIRRFDAGAILTFTGLKELVNALGGIDIYVDQRVTSIHRRPDGVMRNLCRGCANGYSGPQMVYNVGTMRMSGWMAIDYSRQRYVGGADYTRQRHQRQVIRAIVAKVFSSKIASNPAKVDAIVKSLGKMLTFDGRGRKPMEFAYALRKIGARQITLVGLPGGSAYSGGRYIGENLNGIQSSYFAALRADKLDSFLRSHPTLVNKR
jgi:polyisoprenyl-teichoic acid--peptidoglycan teichoic acid transferase